MNRNAIQTAVTCMVLLALSLPALAKKPEIKYEQKDGKITVTIDGELFTEFITADTPKPYLYPIIGPTGAKMTRGYPMNTDNKDESKDHPHHQSLWFAHGSVAGEDFWHSKKGSPTVKSMVSIKSASAQAGNDGFQYISSKEQWLSKIGVQIISGHTAVWIDADEDNTRYINYETNLRPAKGVSSVVYGDTKEGTMAIRLNPALRLKGKVAKGKAVNSQGDKDGKVWGKRAKWVAYWGEIDGKVCGVAIFDHPTNLRHPTWWHARDYGLVAANPFGISDFERGKHKQGTGNYKTNKVLRLFYRFVFFEGDPEQADIAGKYKAWVETTRKK